MGIHSKTVKVVVFCAQCQANSRPILNKASQSNEAHRYLLTAWAITLLNWTMSYAGVLHDTTKAI